MVRVLACEDDAASLTFTQALQQRGFPRQFGTMDGAMRLFLPNLADDDSPFRHRLWTRTRLESYGDDLVDRVCGEIAARAVRGTIPRFFFESIERHDRAQEDLKLDLEQASSKAEKRRIS